MTEENHLADSRHRYRWPWFILGAVLLAILLAILWVGSIARTIREQRQANPPLAPAEQRTR